MRRNRRSRLTHTAVCDINLTNLIDVIMVVLIIYILIAPLVEQGINVNLPEASPHSLDTKDTVTVTITKEDKFYMENTQMSLSAIKDRIVAKSNARPQTSVIIKGDEGVKYGTVIKVLDELNTAGITRVGMATETK